MMIRYRYDVWSAYIQPLGGAKSPFEIFTLRFGHNFQIDHFNLLRFRKSLISNWKRDFFVPGFGFCIQKMYLHFYVFSILGSTNFEFLSSVFCIFLNLKKVQNQGSLIPLFSGSWISASQLKNTDRFGGPWIPVSKFKNTDQNGGPWIPVSLFKNSDQNGGSWIPIT